MRAALINTVPGNAGDELLLVASRRLLNAAGIEISSVHSNQKTIAQTVAPDLVHCDDLEYAVRNDYERTLPRLARRMVHRISSRVTWKLARVLNGPDARFVRSKFEQADFVISGAGGYINSRYGYGRRLWTFEQVLAMGKPLVFFPQSIGPFDRKTSHAELKDVFDRSRAIIVRDDQSLEHLAKLGASSRNIHRFPDLGLLSGIMNRRDAKSSVRAPSDRTVLVSVREWSYGGLPRTALVDRIVKLLHCLVSNEDVKVVCASTCQGLAGYIDDSKLAYEAKNLLPPALQTRIQVRTDHLGCQEYMRLAADCDGYIGMRLHGAIMTMQAGKPALAIGYEEKTSAIFSELGLADCFFDLSESPELWAERAGWFLDHLTDIGTRARAALSRSEYQIANVAARLRSALGLS